MSNSNAANDKVIGDGGPEGTTFGKDAISPVGMHGKKAVQVTVSSTSTSTLTNGLCEVLHDKGIIDFTAGTSEQSGTVDVIVWGGDTEPTLTLEYTVSNGWVSLWIPPFSVGGTGTSLLTLENLPSYLTPPTSNISKFMATVTDNSVSILGAVLVGSTDDEVGAIEISGGVNEDGFLLSGNKGLPRGVSITYKL